MIFYFIFNDYFLLLFNNKSNLKSLQKLVILNQYPENILQKNGEQKLTIIFTFSSNQKSPHYFLTV